MTEAVQKKTLSKPARLLRLVFGICDPRAWAHVFKIVNYYNYSHLQPLRDITLGSGAAISPNATFANAARITAGRGLRVGARSAIWAGPKNGRVVIGDDVLFGPDVLVTAANYRFNDGHPVTEQLMDEADIIIGNDVWLAAKVVVLPGVTIGDGAVIGAGAVVNRDIPPMSIAVGQPARVVGQRSIQPDESTSSHD